MGCVCKCVLDGEETSEFSSIIVKTIEKEQREAAPITPPFPQRIPLRVQIPDRVSTVDLSPIRLTHMNSDASPLRSLSLISEGSQRIPFSHLREKLYASTVWKPSIDASGVTLKYDGGVIMAGELLSLRPDLAQGFIMRWCQLTNDELQLFKDEYQALKGKPIKVLNLQEVDSVISAPDLMLGKASEWKYALEIRLKEKGKQTTPGKISRAKTMPMKCDLTFCAKSIKMRNQWVAVINSLL